MAACSWAEVGCWSGLTGPYEAIFQQQGITFQRQPDSITLSGALKPGRFEVPGDVSSQFITGLLYALPLLDGESEIVLTTALESRGYVDLTLEALKQFGVQVSFTEHGWQVPGGQRYQSADVAVEGTTPRLPTSFWRPAWAIHSRWRACGTDSAQGDRIVCQYAALLDGAGEVTLDVSQCPDLVPALAVRAALRDGAVTRIAGAARLRLKESDRLDAVTVELNRLGGQVEQTADTLTIRGVKTVPRRQLQLPPGPPHCHDAGRGSYLCQRCGRGERSGACGQILPDILGGLQAVGRTVLPDHVRRRV